MPYPDAKRPDETWRMYEHRQELEQQQRYAGEAVSVDDLIPLIMKLQEEVAALRWRVWESGL